MPSPVGRMLAKQLQVFLRTLPLAFSKPSKKLTVFIQGWHMQRDVFPKH